MKLSQDQTRHVAYTMERTPGMVKLLHLLQCHGDIGTATVYRRREGDGRLMHHPGILCHDGEFNCMVVQIVICLMTEIYSKREGGIFDTRT